MLPAMPVCHHCYMRCIGFQLTPGCSSRCYKALHGIEIAIWETACLQLFLPILCFQTEWVCFKSHQLNIILLGIRQWGCILSLLTPGSSGTAEDIAPTLLGFWKYLKIWLCSKTAARDPTTFWHVGECYLVWAAVWFFNMFL